MTNYKKYIKKGDLIKKGKSCGCLIASNVIALEMQKRKNINKIRQLKQKLIKTSSDKETLNLRKKYKELMKSMRNISKNKELMKKRYKDYVRDSGYTPPKLKNKR